MIDSLYTAMIFITVLSSITTLIIMKSFSLLSRHDRLCFDVAFVLVMICTLLEWAQEQVNGRFLSEVWLHYLIVTVEFALSPTISFIFVYALRPRTPHTVLSLISAINFILLMLNLRFRFIFYVDADGIYHRGKYVFLYAGALIISIIYLFAGLILLSHDYHSYNIDAAFAITAFLIIGLSVQLYDRKYMIDWPVITLSSILILVFYSSLVSQSDEMTHLLNRNKFETDCRRLDKRACFITFDINDFKMANDLNGHSFGDKVLRRTADELIAVFGPYGRIYRIGGDEFCAVLTKNPENAEFLIGEFNGRIASVKIDGTPLPTVSTGYAEFEPGKDTVERATALADRYMYRHKENKNN